MWLLLVKKEVAHEIVATSCEALHYRHLISIAPVTSGFCGFPTAEPPQECERAGPHYDKIKDHWDENAEDRSEVVSDVVALVRKHDYNGVDQTQECKGREYRQEALLKKDTRSRGPDAVAGYNPRDQGDAEVLDTPY
jgi:hypothetical protein